MTEQCVRQKQAQKEGDLPASFHKKRVSLCHGKNGRLAVFEKRLPDWEKGKRCLLN